MTELATATFPDGTLPEVHDVMLIASNLFAAGQETTARMLEHRAAAHRRAARARQRCATDASLIPTFVEEIVRLESPIQGNFRLAASRPPGRRRRRSRAGTTLMIMEGAANRDPDQFA